MATYFPVAFWRQRVYTKSRKQPNSCLRGGAKFPTGSDSLRAAAAAGTDSIVWMREGVYGIVTMLFFDACTLEGKSFRVFYFYQKERFFL